MLILQFIKLQKFTSSFVIICWTSGWYLKPISGLTNPMPSPWISHLLPMLYSSNCVWLDIVAPSMTAVVYRDSLKVSSFANNAITDKFRVSNHHVNIGDDVSSWLMYINLRANKWIKQNSSMSCRICSTLRLCSRATLLSQATWTVLVPPWTHSTSDFPLCYHAITSLRSTPVQLIATQLLAAGACSIWSSSPCMVALSSPLTTEVDFSTQLFIAQLRCWRPPPPKVTYNVHGAWTPTAFRIRLKKIDIPHQTHRSTQMMQLSSSRWTSNAHWTNELFTLMR